eukprot:231072_1
MNELPIQRDWIYSWLTSSAYGYIVYTVAIIASIIHPTLFTLHLSRTFMNSNNLSKTITEIPKHTTDKRIIKMLKCLVDVTTLMAIGFGALATIITLINHSSIISNSDTCQPITITQNICWIFTKLCIYHVLIIRLQISFWGSAYDYNRKIMLCAYCCVTIICFICIIGSIIDVDSTYFVTGWCLFIIPTWLILLPCALDVICSLFALYLFLKPLKRTLKDINVQNNPSKKNLAIKVSYLISKMLLLTIIAITSNLFSGIFFAVTDIAIGSFLDTLINPICLILMETKHKKLYRCLCVCCHNGVERMLFGSSKRMKLIEMKRSTYLSTTKSDTKNSEMEDDKDEYTEHSAQTKVLTAISDEQQTKCTQ